MIVSKYRVLMYTDDANYKWCKKRGIFCPKDEYGWFCDECCR